MLKGLYLENHRLRIYNRSLTERYKPLREVKVTFRVINYVQTADTYCRLERQLHLKTLYVSFDVSLTVQLSVILIINQLNAHIF